MFQLEDVIFAFTVNHTPLYEPQEIIHTLVRTFMKLSSHYRECDSVQNGVQIGYVQLLGCRLCTGTVDCTVDWVAIHSMQSHSIQ